MGLDLIPQVHEGPQVREMEKRGISSDKGSFNRWVRSTNKLISDIVDSLKEIGSWLEEARETLKTLSSENTFIRVKI